MSVLQFLKAKTETVILALYAAFAVAGPLFTKQYDDWSMSVPGLYRRAGALSRTSDRIQRDRLCIPLSARIRALDAALPADARIFVLRMLGKDNRSNGGYYYFLNYYLFPRDVDISVDPDSVYIHSWFEGIPCTSPAQLLELGYTHAADVDPERGLCVYELRKDVPDPKGGGAN